MKKFGVLAIVLLLVLIVLEILKVYFIMPFPGSQEEETIEIAYALHNNMWFLRILGWVVLIYLVLKLKPIKVWAKVIVAIVFGLYALVFYAFNFVFLADKMFYQPEVKSMVGAAENKIPLENIVLGFELNGEARAYPLQLIGYHHQVLDTIGDEPVMITYCTVCRTGRVYKPKVNGKNEEFRLVGMDHFNAMFEDKTTKSWWYQATGEAIIGDLKGIQLEEIYAEQTTLKSWLEQHPTSLIMQPDEKFKKQYDDLEGYGSGKIGEADNKLEGRDTASWQKKSWVVGINMGNNSKAYDWNELKQKHIINDTLNGKAVLITLEKDEHTFHAFSRKMESINTVLSFSYDAITDVMNDDQTSSSWNLNGKCVDGALKGKKLKPIQAYQEFWHSWQNFHPHTTKY
jgi:hypothetical protein